jgi:hypothetical protein
MRSKLMIAAAFAAVAVLVLPAAVPAAGVKLEAALDGQEEVPEKGDPNGSGLAKVTVKRAQKKICSRITYDKIEVPNAAHIHKGKEGVAGPIKVDLFEEEFESGERDCVEVSKRLARKIEDKPKNYYVNLHNAEYPDGAVRGQLEG